MEKYQINKTIGDGTYGSVVKAHHLKTGNIYFIITYSPLIRRDSRNQEDEKEVLQLGLMHELKGNPVSKQASSSEYCQVV
jgi:serine/threonine protein kinase